VEESNLADSSPARAFRERLATVHRHFPGAPGGRRNR